MSGERRRLHVFQAVDDFGPGLQSEPYWRAEIDEWRRGFATWREALHRGLAELARRAER